MAENGRIYLNRPSYTNVGSVALFDAALSMRAKGLYATMTAFACIPNFKLYKKHLMKQFPEGSTAFNSAWNELINRGYLVMEKKQDESGKYIYDYSVQDTPVEVPEEDQRKTKRIREKKKPHMEKPHLDEPHVENPPLKVNTKDNYISERKAQVPQEEPKEEKKELSEEAMIVNTLAPHEVIMHDNYDPHKLVKVAKGKDGRQYKDDDLAKILSETNTRFIRQYNNGKVGDSWSYYLRVVKSVANQWEAIKSGKRKQPKKTPAPNSAHNFHQRDYDYDQLEKDILMAQW